MLGRCINTNAACSHNSVLRASSVVFAIFSPQNSIFAKTTLFALKSLFYLDFRSIAIVGSRPAKI